MKYHLYVWIIDPVKPKVVIVMAKNLQNARRMAIENGITEEEVKTKPHIYTNETIYLINRGK